MKNFDNLYKKIIKEQNESYEDLSPENGWSDDVKSVLEEVLNDADSLAYEINNCVKGSFTHCETEEDLAEYLKNLAERIQNTANVLSNSKEGI